MSKLRSFSAIALLPAAGIAILTLSPVTHVTSVRAAGRNGELHVTKECSQNKGQAGDFCTITSSDLSEITVGAKVFYDQPAGIPSGLLDSNVVLDAGNGDRALGHCTLDLKTGLGLCMFSDGTGQFTGFNARVSVDCTSGCRWDGVYRFRNLT
jgi:hypothetical protein